MENAFANYELKTDPHTGAEYLELCTGYVLTWKVPEKPGIYLTVEGGLAVMKKWMDGEPMIIVKSAAISTAMIAGIEPLFNRVAKSKEAQKKMESGEFFSRRALEERISLLSLPSDLQFGSLQGGYPADPGLLPVSTKQ